MTEETDRPARPNPIRLLTTPTDSPAQWRLALAVPAASGAGLGVGLLLGWGRTSLLVAIASLPAVATAVMAPDGQRLRTAVLAGAAGFLAVGLAGLTADHPLAAALAMAAVAVLTSTVAAAGTVGVGIGLISTLAFVLTAGLAALRPATADASTLGIALRVAVGSVLGLVLAGVAGRLGRAAGSAHAETMPSPWRMMFASLRSFDGHAREGVRRAVVLAPGMYLLQRSGTREALWIFVGALAVLLSPIKLRPVVAAVGVLGAIVGAVLIVVLSLFLSTDALLLMGALTIVPALAYRSRYPLLGTGATAMSAIVIAGAPGDEIGAWAGSRVIDAMIGCGIALAAHRLMWPRDQPDDDADATAAGALG